MLKLINNGLRKAEECGTWRVKEGTVDLLCKVRLGYPYFSFEVIKI